MTCSIRGVLDKLFKVISGRTAHPRSHCSRVQILKEFLSGRFPEMTVSELIEKLAAMPPDATVMLWNRMDDPQHRKIETVDVVTRKSDPSAEIVVLS
jgi:hypothetical protein